MTVVYSGMTKDQVRSALSYMNGGNGGGDNPGGGDSPLDNVNYPASLAGCYFFNSNSNTQLYIMEYNGVQSFTYSVELSSASSEDASVAQIYGTLEYNATSGNAVGTISQCMIDGINESIDNSAFSLQLTSVRASTSMTYATVEVTCHIGSTNYNSTLSGTVSK